MQHCLRHMEEPSTAQCRSCQGTYCNRCLVFSFGPRKPPYCVGCALHASGVRPGSRKVTMPPPPLSEPEMAANFGRPVAFDRQAEKDAARATASTPTEAEAGGLSIADSPSLGDDVLEPVLAPNERRLLSRLTANRLAEV